MTQRMILISSPHFISEGRMETIESWQQVFGNDRPLALEIGCGVGDFMVQLAAQQPEVNFIAIDIYNKGCLKTCKKIDEAGLTNVRVVRAEAIRLLTEHFGKESLSAIYINCPDPWPKKRHRGRRLVNGEFLSLALYYLRPEGDFYFSTDFDDYAEGVAEIFPRQAGYRNRQGAPLTHELPGYPVSKYMRRFLDLGQPIHYIHYSKEAGFLAGPELLPGPRQGFRARAEAV